jgi:hypothetical protein
MTAAGDMRIREAVMAKFYSDLEQSRIDALGSEGIKIEWLAGLCPVQSEGHIDGHAYYFRARGAMWEMAIVPTDSVEIAVNHSVFQDQDYGWYHRQDYGTFPDAGYMPFIEAIDFIEWSAKQYRKTVAPPA